MRTTGIEKRYLSRFDAMPTKNALAQYGEMKPSPRNALLGYVADALGSANAFATQPSASKPGASERPALNLLAELAGLNSLAVTANRLSYGDPLTNAKKANVPFLKPETADALMMAPLSPRTALAALSGGMADTGAMKAVDVLFYRPKSFAERAAIDDAGVVKIPITGGVDPRYIYADKARELAQEKFAPKYDGYFRFTNNKAEPTLAASGKLRNSMNHAEGFAEPGLSVADGPHYGIQGYKYGYRLDGDVVGYGSDGEPLLNPAALKILSEMMPAQEIVRADKARQAEILRKAGLPEDYMRTVRFLNDPLAIK